MFSVKIAVGASSAPLEVDRIADSRAPKNMIWMKPLAWFMIRFGRISWNSGPSLSRAFATASPSISSADTAMNIGTNANSR